MLGRAKELNLTTSLDPGWDPYERWNGILDEALSAVDILFVNEHEVKAIAGMASVDKAATALARRVNLVLAKLGADGALAADQDGVFKIPAFPVEVVDTTGAGDSFNAGFIFKFIVDGETKPKALRFANACGAIAATRVGGASSVPSASEVETFLIQQPV